MCNNYSIHVVLSQPNSMSSVEAHFLPLAKPLAGLLQPHRVFLLPLLKEAAAAPPCLGLLTLMGGVYTGSKPRHVCHAAPKSSGRSTACHGAALGVERYLTMPCGRVTSCRNSRAGEAEQ